MISEELQEIYSSNKMVRYYEALIISHPKFSQIYYIVDDTVDHLFMPDGKTEVKFKAVPFKIVLPQVGETQQDLRIVLPNIGYGFQQEIEYANDTSKEPISVVYQVYIEGDQLPQSEFNYLKISAVTLDETTITGTASRADMFNVRFLENNLFDDRFEGLYL